MTITIALGGKKPPPGVVLGSCWIRVVALGLRRGRPFLDKLGRAPLYVPDADKEQQTILQLNELWKQLGIKDNSVISAMTGHAVIIKHVTIPAGAAANMDRFLAKEAKQYIPFDLQDVYLDHQVLGPGPKEGTLDIILVASKKQEVEQRLGILTKAGLKTRVMDVDAFALSNCFEFNYPEFNEKPQYLLDLGGQLSIFCVIWRNQLIFQRELGMGGQQFTDRLAKVFKKSRMDCEKMKINGPGDLAEQDRAVLARELGDVVNSWVSEIRRLIGFYIGSVPGSTPAENLFLSGGASLLFGLKDMLAKELELEVQFLNPWRKLDPDPNRFDPAYLQAVGPQFAVPVGLALREVLS